MKILYLTNHNSSSNVINDYMSDLLLHGLREVHGNDVIDYPGPWYLYKDESKKRNLDTNLLWGKGFTTRNSLDNFNSIDRNDIKSKIKNRYFDLIVYSSIRRSSLFLEDVIKYNNKFIFVDGEDDQIIDSKFSNISVYFKRELSLKKKNIYPIYFAIPENKIINKINQKPKRFLAPLIPGRQKTYIYNNEYEYYQMYQDSLFALTYKKGGWDCLRHYEILMNGCLPLFLNLDQCPNLTLTQLPKRELIQILNNYQKILSFFFPTKIFKKKNINVGNFINYLRYFFSKDKNIDYFLGQNDKILSLRSNLLEYTKRNLTTKKLANHLIDTSHNSLK